jgi:hypothetical protein
MSHEFATAHEIITVSKIIKRAAQDRKLPIYPSVTLMEQCIVGNFVIVVVKLR